MPSILGLHPSYPTSPRGSAVAWWLMPRTPDPEVGGSSPTGSNRFVSLSKAHFPQKVLETPRKRWLRTNMTEKLFSGTLRINQPTNQPITHNPKPCYPRPTPDPCSNPQTSPPSSILTFFLHVCYNFSSLYTSTMTPPTPTTDRTPPVFILHFHNNFNSFYTRSSPQPPPPHPTRPIAPFDFFALSQ